jgi:hypothetical protein
MNRVASVYGKKLFSLTLIFNSLLSIVYAIGVLAVFYANLPSWKPFWPYLVDGNLFWVVIVASIINIFPATIFGRVKTGRIWFHHYVYGFFVSASTATLLILFTSVSLLTLFTTNITDISVNVGRFFILGGLTLVLDDLPDVSRVTASFTGWLKSKAYQTRKIIHAVQCLMGLVSLYFFASVSTWIANYPQEATLANLILVGTLLITSLLSFVSVKRKIWLNIKPEQT